MFSHGILSQPSFKSKYSYIEMNVDSKHLILFWGFIMYFRLHVISIAHLSPFHSFHDPLFQFLCAKFVLVNLYFIYGKISIPAIAIEERWSLARVLWYCRTREHLSFSVLLTASLMFPYFIFALLFNAWQLLSQLRAWFPYL